MHADYTTNQNKITLHMCIVLSIVEHSVYLPRLEVPCKTMFCFHYNKYMSWNMPFMCKLFIKLNVAFNK